VRALVIVRRLLTPHLSLVHSKRVEAVFAVVSWLLLGGRLSLSALGRSARGSVAPRHCIKRVDRLLGNHLLHPQVTWFFRAIASVLLAGVDRPVLLVDWTDVGAEHCALVAALAIEGRALPIYLEVHPKKLYANRQIERCFLKALYTQVVPKRCRPIVVTDAGYQNPWFLAVRELGWDFVGRTCINVLSSPYSGDAHTDIWTSPDEFHACATTTARDLGWRWLAMTNPLDVRMVVAKRRPKGRKGSPHATRKGVHPRSTAYKKYQKRGRRPWLLATSLDEESANQIVELYARRMCIEETFRDTKNHRFGWSFEDARSHSPKRLQVLLLLASIGTLALHLLGVAAEHRELHLRYQANTIRDRRVLSHFVLGKQIIARQETRMIGDRMMARAIDYLRRIIDYAVPPLEPMAGSALVGIP
jgi:hypothetical protein